MVLCFLSGIKNAARAKEELRMMLNIHT